MKHGASFPKVLTPLPDSGQSEKRTCPSVG